MKNKLLTKLLLLPALLLVGSSAYAQLTVTGNVSDASGPVPGVNIVVQGTSNGAQSDFDGNYAIDNVANDATLVFSYLGYTTQEVAVNGQSTINVTLQEDVESLGEVVLIGYGSTTVKDATGSVASVTSEEFNQGVISSPEQLLQGKVAGVQITETSGEPGAGINFNIRGSNSIRSGNSPLFVIDGVPLAGGGAPAGGVGTIGAAAQRNPLAFLNPGDIESISILKDASATAIYGSRGANGVVIVKTKSGRGNTKGTWDVSSTVSTATAANSYELLNRDGYLQALEDFGNDPVALDFGSSNDFQDFYTRTSTSTRNDISYSRSFSRANVRASFGYAKQVGIVKNTDQERVVGRLNAMHKFLDNKLTLDFQGTISRVNDQNAPISGAAGSTGDLIGASITANPTWPIAPVFNPGSNLLNPVNLLANYLSESRTNRFLANLSATYDITDEFSVKVLGGYDTSDGETTSVFGPGVAGLNQVSGVGDGVHNTLDQENTLLEATIQYNKDFGNVTLDAVAGYSYQKFDRNGFFSGGRGYRPGTLDQLADRLEGTYDEVSGQIEGDFQQFGYDQNGGFVARFDPNGEVPFVFDNIANTFDRDINAYYATLFDNFDELQSFFVRANFSIADKYLITGTFRADGSTLFGEDKKYGYFPSGAFAWKLHNEDFVGDAFSTLKLRLGAGAVGNSEGLSFGNALLRTGLVNIGFNGDGTITPPGTRFLGNNNPDLQWESTIDYNLGIDFGFNDDRVNGTINVYRRETDNQLLTSALAAPQQTGIPTIFRNLSDGSVVNQGIEFGLGYDFVRSEDWDFGMDFNIAYNQNEVLDTELVIDAGPINGNGLTGAFAQRIQAGEPLFSYYVAEFTGFDDQGFPTYRDVNGDGVGDPDSDKTFVGKSALPEITGGLSLNARYKNFSLNTFFNAQAGFYVYNATDNAFFTAGGIVIGKNVTEAAVTSGEDGAASTAVSDRFLEKGDFIRMQNATLSYDWPLAEDSFFDSFRLSVTGQNLFILTDYSGLDPEVSVNTGSINASNIPTRGIDYAAYPRPRTVTFGVNARF
ncbi:MAG: SusC/RagA family TonB-linked outer membrane protein [Bacteroidota bacterium]